MSFANVLKATVFITDMKFYGDFNKVYGPYWTDNGLTPPARAAVEVGVLPGSKPGAPVLVEVSMIAGKRRRFRACIGKASGKKKAGPRAGFP